jgi:Ca2+-binding RTX toxin-like protein
MTESEIFVFGDSLSDPGNSFKLTGGVIPPAAFYFNGRASNGPLALEILAARNPNLALNPTNNFAFIGARTGQGNSNEDDLGGVDLPGLRDQIDAFRIGIGAGKADKNGLYTIWAGPNDFLDFLGGSTSEDPAVLVAQGAANLTYAASTLNSLGAQKIVLPNMADLGQLPFSRGFQTEATAISKAFNAAVDLELGNLKFDVTAVDLFATPQEVGKNPAKFGFTNVTDPLLLLKLNTPPPPVPGTPEFFSNPAQFFFWDVFHPTTEGHAVLADTIDRTLTGEIPQLSFNQIFGTQKNDVLNGTSANDDLRGDAGNDLLNGRNGDDRLQGEDGNDRLFGERGDDILSGGNGDDCLWGGQGNDIVFGGSDNDRLWGESGEDILIGDDGNDLIYGGAGNDYLLGGSGRDRLWGDAGEDILNGGGDEDLLFGGAGNDDLFGGGGDDTIFGGAGADRFRFANLINQGIDSMKDFQSGIDKMIISALGFGGGLQAGTTVTAEQFLATTSSTATTTEQRLIYDSTTGGLFFDADGSGLGSSAVQFAALYVDPLNPVQPHPIGLTAADFSLI